MASIRFITLEQVIEIHDAILESFDGIPGIRSKHLLISAIETPKAMMFGKFLHETIYDKAAAYLFHLVQNHPFIDGNKRTGSVTAILFLEVNGILVNFSNELFEDLVVNIAKGEKSKDHISQFLKHQPK